MALAFLIGAVASGFSAAAATSLFVWVAVVVSGSTTPWAIAPWLVTVVAALVAIGTYAAEGIAHRRTLARMHLNGEPWAYRES